MVFLAVAPTYCFWHWRHVAEYMFVKRRLKTLGQLPDTVIQTSIDIESMYPTLPTCQRALSVMYQYIRKYSTEIDMFGFEPHHIVSMLQFVVNHVYTTVNGVYYRQLNGVGTGYHSSGAFSEILVDFTYSTALQKSGIVPISLSLYVDNAHSMWQNDEQFTRFLKELNKIWETMKFTSERADERNELSFLHVLVRITTDSKLEFELYQKPTHSGRYLEYSSHCSTQTKLNIISTETRRVVDVCSSMELAWPHLERIRGNFIDSGYPPATTSRIIKNTVSEMLYPKPKNSTVKADKVKRERKYILKVPYIYISMKPLQDT